MTTLFLAAVREELGALDGDVVGVGAVVAAARAGALLATRRPAAVVLVGTAGAYPGGPPIGAVVAAELVALDVGVATLGLGYVPLAPPAIPGDPRLLDVAGLPRHRVLTTTAITTDPEHARRLGASFTVEHLEAFGVARACADVGVPFLAILGITNVVGPGAHREWLANRGDAEAGARRAAGLLASGRGTTGATVPAPRTP